MGEYDYEAGHHLVGNNEPAQPQETVGFRLNHLMVRIKVFRPSHGWFFKGTNRFSL